MHSLFSLAVVLRLGTFVTVPSMEPALSVREEVHAVAAESALQALREDEERQEREEYDVPLALRGDWVHANPFRVHYRYRPVDWIRIAATQLHVEDTFPVRTILWFASWPVALQATENRVYARITLTIP